MAAPSSSHDFIRKWPTPLLPNALVYVQPTVYNLGIGRQLSIRPVISMQPTISSPGARAVYGVRPIPRPSEVPEVNRPR